MRRGALAAVAVGFAIGAWTNPSMAESRSPSTIAVVDSALTDSTVLAGKVVYVDFWASWCVPCRKSYPWMNELAAKYHDRGLEIVTINVDKDRKAADKFLADLKASLPVIYDPKGELAKFYELKVMPTSFVYGRGGKLEERHEGFQPADGPGLDSLIAVLLKETPSK